MGVTIAQLSARLRCAECGGQLHSVKPWRLQDVLGKSLGRRGWTPLGNLHLWASPCFCSTASVEAFATPCLGVADHGPATRHHRAASFQLTTSVGACAQWGTLGFFQ